MVPLIFNSTTLAYVPLNLCFDQTTPSLLSKHRRASTLKEPKELHLDDHTQYNFNLCVCGERRTPFWGEGQERDLFSICKPNKGTE